ncbi:hypothetical protein LXL04_024561 [Taraxacum kok-saghyz]
MNLLTREGEEANGIWGFLLTLIRDVGGMGSHIHLFNSPPVDSPFATHAEPGHSKGLHLSYVAFDLNGSRHEEDIWTEIAKYLERKSLVMLAATSKWFLRVVMDESVWKFACLRDLQVPDCAETTFKWIKLYASAFGGSHSYDFRQKEKHIGQKPENPLLLLGQYSDEDTEVFAGKEISHDTSENSPSEFDEQVKVDSHEGTVTEADKDKDENFPSEKSDQDNMERPSSLEVQENGVIEDITVLPLHKDMDTVHAAEQTFVPWASDTLAQTESTDSGWKMVLHEESNSYYYWNTLTGQTSWENGAYEMVVISVSSYYFSCYCEGGKGFLKLVKL